MNSVIFSSFVFHSARFLYYKLCLKPNNMKDKNTNEKGGRGRRFREAVDGPMIKKWYARMQTARLARLMGLTVRQIENYVYRHNLCAWARKLPTLLSALNSKKGKKGGGRPKKVGK